MRVIAKPTQPSPLICKILSTISPRMIMIRKMINITKKAIKSKCSRKFQPAPLLGGRPPGGLLAGAVGVIGGVPAPPVAEGVGVGGGVAVVPDPPAEYTVTLVGIGVTDEITVLLLRIRK